jgi:predicted kinase
VVQNLIQINKKLDERKMEKQSKSESVLVMVMGLPGSGKSFFAKALAKEIGAEYLGSDELRKELGLMGHYSLDNKLVVYQEMFLRAKELHKSGKSAVLDGTFFLQQVRDLFIFLARSLSWKMSIIQISADEDLITKRLSKPREDSEADLGVYQKIKSEFEPIQEKHLSLPSLDGNLVENLEKALEFIQADHGKTRSQAVDGQWKV